MMLLTVKESNSSITATSTKDLSSKESDMATDY
jgi:hypothetical protein